MNAVSAFIKEVDKRLFERCSAARGDEAILTGNGATRYYNVGPTRVSVWFVCESFGGEITATVCNDDGVLDSPDKICDALIMEARWRMEEDGVTPAF